MITITTNTMTLKWWWWWWMNEWWRKDDDNIKSAKSLKRNPLNKPLLDFCTQHWFKASQCSSTWASGQDTVDFMCRGWWIWHSVGQLPRGHLIGAIVTVAGWGGQRMHQRLRLCLCNLQGLHGGKHRLLPCAFCPRWWGVELRGQVFVLQQRRRDCDVWGSGWVLGRTEGLSWCLESCFIW